MSASRGDAPGESSLDAVRSSPIEGLFRFGASLELRKPERALPELFAEAQHHDRSEAKGLAKGIKSRCRAICRTRFRAIFPGHLVAVHLIASKQRRRS